MSMKSKTRLELARRSLLKGGAASLFLPLLPELNVQAQAGDFPKRLVVFYVPEGIEPRYWWPKTTGTNYELQDSLASLATHRNDLTVIKGINLQAAYKPMPGYDSCYHKYCMPQLLTGGINGPSVQASGASFSGGTSINVMLGRFNRGPAPFETYEFGVTCNNAPIDRVISFDGKVQREPVNSPYAAYGELSGKSGTAQTPSQNTEQIVGRKRRVLDLLQKEISDLRCALGRESQRKLEAHLGAVEKVENQLNAFSSGAGATFKDRVSPIDAKWQNDFMNLSLAPDLGKLQMDLLVAALASDLTRSAVLQWSATVSRLTFSWLGLNMGDYHNAIAHNTSAEAQEARRKICAWWAEQFAYLISKMKSIPEGNGTLLDNSVIVYVSEMSIGNEHNPRSLPIIVAGGGGGKIRRPGQFIDFAPTTASPGRSINDLWLTLCQAFGMNLSKFGSPEFCQGPISEILT